eukprot:6190699-Pleurochrysis_carterae.AAC.4
MRVTTRVTMRVTTRVAGSVDEDPHLGSEETSSRTSHEVSIRYEKTEQVRVRSSPHGHVGRSVSLSLGTISLALSVVSPFSPTTPTFAFLSLSPLFVLPPPPPALSPPARARARTALSATVSSAISAGGAPLTKRTDTELTQCRSFVDVRCSP